MIYRIGQFECRVLRDTMHIATQFNDRARMYINTTGIQIRAKTAHNTAIAWINIPASKSDVKHSSEDPTFATDIGIDCEKLYRILNAYEADEKIQFCIEHREGIGELAIVAGAEGTLRTYQTALNNIDQMPGMHAIRSAHPLPASGAKGAEVFRDWLRQIECKDDPLSVSFVHDKEHERYTLWGVSDTSGCGCVLNSPKVPEESDNLRTTISFELLQMSLAPECIDDCIKFSFGNDTTLFMETQVNGCNVAMAIAPRIE